MSSAPPTETLPHEPSIAAALLSLLIPGLGQIMQRRFGKGLLFMVSLLGMFFLGQAMGNWQNVYVPRTDEGVPGRGRGGFVAGLLQRWHYAGQVWIGVAAWPAIWQHLDMPMPKEETSPFWHNYQKMPDEARVNRFLVNSDKSPDLGWVYTVIAGMLNILVIYDAYAGAAILGMKPTIKPQTVAAPAETPAGGAV